MTLLYLGLAVWWAFAVVIFAFMTYDGEPSKERLGIAVFWPILAPMAFVVMLWRIPFKTAKAIRTALRNRKLLKDFEGRGWRGKNR